MTEFSKTFPVFYKWPDLTDVQVALTSTVRASGVSTLYRTVQNNSKMNSSSDFPTWLVEGPMGAKQFCTVTLNNTCFCIFFYVNTIDDKLKCSQRLHCTH